MKRLHQEAFKSAESGGSEHDDDESGGGEERDESEEEREIDRKLELLKRARVDLAQEKQAEMALLQHRLEQGDLPQQFKWTQPSMARLVDDLDQLICRNQTERLSKQAAVYEESETDLFCLLHQVQGISTEPQTIVN